MSYVFSVIMQQRIGFRVTESHDMKGILITAAGCSVKVN